MTHSNPELTIDGATIDVSNDFYHHYKEDIRRARSIGVSIQILFASRSYEYFLIPSSCVVAQANREYPARLYVVKQHSRHSSKGTKKRFIYKYNQNIMSLINLT